MKTAIKNTFFAILACLFFPVTAIAAETKEEEEEEYHQKQYVSKDKTFFDIGKLTKTLTGELRLAHNREGQFFAIKIASTRPPTNPKIRDDPHRELMILHYLSQINQQEGAEQIIKLDDCGHSEDFMWMALPFANSGDGIKYLVASGPLSPNTAQMLFCDLALGLDFLHRNGVVHLDISLENCLIHVDERNNSVKLIITDMGLARFTDGGLLSAKELNCGKTHYMAPEISYAPSCDPKAVDVWSTGICLYILATNARPIIRASLLCERYRFILYQGVDKLLAWDVRNLPNKPSRDYVALLKNLVRTNPLNRLTSQEILESDFVRAERIRRSKTQPMP